ncbi:hypothetical protein SUGI_0268850 [Cryptomeria japonica]|nr:hypothetical protein SUGI_0268850 [Cryptomeria japonica]
MASQCRLNELKSSSPPAVWECGSNLYDSYDLFTFTQHLQRAISSQPSPSITKDGRVRSLSTPHFTLTPSSQLFNTLVKEDEPITDVDLSYHSKIELLHTKTWCRLGVPKLVQRLFARLGRDGSGEKQHDLHCKVGRTAFERILYTAVHYCYNFCFR